MKKLLLLTLTLSVLINHAQEIDAPWTKTFGNEQNTELILSMDTDPFGNLISTGVYLDAIDFDPSETENILAGDGLRNIFIQKLSNDGDLIWAKSIEGTGVLQGHSLTTDNSGNIYIGGGFRGTADFNPGESEEIRTAEFFTDAFLLKLDANGNFQWVNTMGSDINDYFFRIEIGSDGNLYTTGEFTGTIDFNPGPGETIISSVDATDVFVAKYNSDGDLYWAHSFGNENSDRPAGFALDSDDNIIISGNFRSNMDVDPSDEEYVLESVGYHPNYIVKWTSDAEFIWAKSFGTDDYFDFNVDLGVDNEDNIYAIGRYYGSVDFNPGPATFILSSIGEENNNYMLKLNSDGEFVLARSIGNTTGVIGIQDLIIDDENGLYFTGNFYTTVDFNPNPGSYPLTSEGLNDYFIMKLDEDFNFEWATSMGADSIEVGYEMAVHESELFVSGVFMTSVDFNPNEAINEFESNGQKDIFIQKLIPAFAGISDLQETDLFPIYPNPTNSNVNIVLNKHESYIITLSDISGKIISKTTVVNAPTYLLEITGDPGIFLLSIYDYTTTSTKKIIKF